MNNSNFKLDERRTKSLMKTEIMGKYINKSSYLNSLGVSVSAYNNNVKKIKESDPEFYESYLRVKEENMNQFIDERCEIVSLINEMIINGIEFENGMIGEFELIDWYIKYYEYFEGVSKSVVSTVIDERDKRNIGISGRAIHARQLISKASNTQIGNYYTLISKKHILENTSYGLTDEEKMFIIKNFDLYKIPYNYANFDIAAKRVINYRNYCFTNSCELDYNTCFSGKIKVRQK